MTLFTCFNFQPDRRSLKGSKGQICFFNRRENTNYFKWQKFQRQHVPYGQRNKSVHGDPNVGRIVQGSKVKIVLYMTKIINNVRFCSGLLHLVWIEVQNKKVNDVNSVKGRQKVIWVNDLFSIDWKLMTTSNSKFDIVNMFYMVRDLKRVNGDSGIRPTVEGSKVNGHFLNYSRLGRVLRTHYCSTSSFFT